MSIVVIFFMRDLLYASQLMAYFRRNSSQSMESVYIANAEELRRYMQSGGVAGHEATGYVQDSKTAGLYGRKAFVLAEEDYCDEIKPLLNDKGNSKMFILYLSKREGTADGVVRGEDGGRSSEQRIYMYAAPADIMRRLFYSAESDEPSTGVRITLFCSPWGRSGVSTLFALSCMCAAEHGGRVLGINVSQSPVIFEYLGGQADEAADFNRIMYGIKSGNDISEEMFSKSNAGVGEACILDGGKYVPEVFETSGEELLKLTYTAEKYGFSEILIDCGRPDIARVRLFEAAHRVIMPCCGGDKYEMSKYGSFIGILKRVFGEGAEQAEKKIKVIKNTVTPVCMHGEDEIACCGEVGYDKALYLPDKNCKGSKGMLNKNGLAACEVKELWRSL